MVNGSVDGVQFSLFNIYAPNNNEPNFMHNIFSNVLQHSSGILLLGGDFNCVMSPHMDRQPSSKTPPSQMSKVLKHFITELGLVDIWKSRFPRSKDFTFYSHRHLSYSTIYLFFTPKTEEYRTEKIEILLITLSDHALLTLTWNLGQTPKIKHWRLNASLLNDREFCDYLNSELNAYLELNAAPEMSPLILWDCAKAYIRGQIISFASAKRKKREARQCKLQNNIKFLEQQHKKTPTTKLFN